MVTFEEMQLIRAVRTLFHDNNLKVGLNLAREVIAMVRVHDLQYPAQPEEDANES